MQQLPALGTLCENVHSWDVGVGDEHGVPARYVDELVYVAHRAAPVVVSVVWWDATAWHIRHTGSCSADVRQSLRSVREDHRHEDGICNQLVRTAKGYRVLRYTIHTVWCNEVPFFYAYTGAGRPSPLPIQPHPRHHATTPAWLAWCDGCCNAPRPATPTTPPCSPRQAN